MPRQPIAKFPKLPRHAEPHTITIENMDAYLDMTSQPPYTYIRGRQLPQYVLALMLANLHAKGKRYLRIYLPAETLPTAYQFNPAAFAMTVRRQSNCPFQYVTARMERGVNRVRITASETAPQKASNYLGDSTALLLSQWEKDHHKGFSLVFLFEGMPRSYQNDHRVFRFRLQQNLRTHTGDQTIELAIQVLTNGYRISKIPQS